MKWQFDTPMERFDVGQNEAAWHHIVVPPAIAREAHEHKRFIITLNNQVSWHCAINVTCEADHQEAGIHFCYVAKQHARKLDLMPGEPVSVSLIVDESPYGMEVHPALQEMLDEDALFLTKFDAMLPGKRRGHLLQIAKAKSDATVAKRIANLMTELGLALALLLGANPAIVKAQSPSQIALGHDRTEAYVNLLRDKKVAVVGNHTAVFETKHGHVHLVDSLMSLGIEVSHVFAPEHGFRGESANGAHIHDGVDEATGLPVHSLHGAHKKPQPEHLDIDVLVFDIQDVGARFYTYVSSMILCMEACAEAGVDIIILDRPNPHGHHVQGPMLDPALKSFVGWIPTPMVHGMTLGELALMAQHQGWFEGAANLSLQVIPCLGWDHDTPYELSVRPSPNLPTSASIDLYPSLCLFEPTAISVGRGTDAPFEVLGHPTASFGSYAFTPRPVAGAAPNPKHNGKTCYGQSLVGMSMGWRQQQQLDLGAPLPGFSLEPLWAWADMWRMTHDGTLEGFFTSPGFFDKLAGTDEIRLALEAQTPLEELESTWRRDHDAFLQDAQPYLLYPWSRVNRR